MTLESGDYFFFELDQDFYDTSVPSQDIWKKFELLPTPPRSPSRDPGGGGLSPSAEDTLQMVSEYINEDDPVCRTLCSDLIRDIFDEDIPDDIVNSFDVPVTQPESILISDCMWSASLKDELYSGKSDKNTQNTTTRSSNNNTETPTLDIESTVCVDPTVVFPYPSVVEINQASLTTTQTPRVTSASTSNMLHMTREHSYSLGTDTPSPSDSEEEIDVVTVDKDKYTVCTKRKSTTSSSMPNTTVVTLQPQSKQLIIKKSPGLPTANISKKRLYHSISSPNSPQSHPIKKLRRETSVPEVRSSHFKYRSHHQRSPATSDDVDSEDSEGKRAQHNVLERKRRNDLKYSFLTLRDHVPELRAQERAPKVTILKMAAEYIQNLTHEEQTLSAELEHQKDKKEQLLRRLSSLRWNSCL